jgi:hypothetical protein
VPGTFIVPTTQTLEVDADATNPGQWMLHCHHAYHGEAGMMTVLSYVHCPRRSVVPAVSGGRTVFSRDFRCADW